MSEDVLDFISTRNPPEFQSEARIGGYCPAMVKWTDRLLVAYEAKRRAAGKGYDAKTLADEAGVPYNSVTKYLKGETDNPRGDRLGRLAQALNCTEEWLRFGDQPAHYVVQMIGWVGAAEQWHAMDEADHDEYVEIELAKEDVFALQVRGTSMAPVYNDRDIIICSRKEGRDILQAVGKDCVVKTVDGELLVKKLLRDTASTTTLFRLRSYNSGVADREGVMLEWAAPVMFIKRN